MYRGVVEWRIILRGDAVKCSLLAGPFRHPSLSPSSRVPAFQPPVVVNSIPWSGAIMLLATRLRVIDELQGFATHAAARLTSMLSETRKFQPIAVLSDQTLDQVPDRMCSGLQNGEVDITFRTGRDDAAQQANLVGRVDPVFLKHKGAPPERVHHRPSFASLQSVC